MQGQKHRCREAKNGDNVCGCVLDLFERSSSKMEAKPWGKKTKKHCFDFTVRSL